MSRRLAWTGLVLGLLLGLAQAGVHRSPTDAAELEPREPDCQRADSVLVAQLQPLLTRNRPGDAGVIDRAVHGLNVARKHCLYGWSDSSLDSYRWLGQWIEDHR